MGKFFDIPHALFSHAKKKNTTTSRLTALMAGASPLVLGAAVTAMLPNGGYAQAVNMGGLASNNIVASGRTKTKIAVKGNHTKIRTDTVSAGVGFNSFSDFQQAAGQRVDLFVPDQAGSLVNIVSNGAVVINGELNSYKDGKIGGNIFFSNSNGFIVGTSGRVNVGSLTVNTPTKAFLDKIIRADGTINNAVARQLMLGEIPVSKNGVIAIAGQVNAKGSITLQGHTVTVNGKTGPLTGQDIGQRLKFGATVNSTGLQEGAALVSRGGQISIVAAGNATIGGRINANAKTSGKGGKVTVKSVGDIKIESSAEVSADGAGVDGAGGDIVFFADTKIITENGSSFSARGAGTGDGGFVEISGKYAKIGAGRYDLGSDFGRAGTLLFDPIDLVIDAASGSVSTNGGNIALEADESITIASGGVLDSSNGGGVAGSILIEAPKITLSNGSTVTAGTTGDVTLSAVRTGGGDAEIIIGDGAGAAPILSGNNITLTASSTADNTSLLVDIPTASATITITAGDIDAAGTLTANATATTNGDLSAVALPIGVVVTNASATVEVGGTSDIDADAVSLNANSTVISNIVTESLAPANSAADGAVAVSTINSTAIARITGGATVQATNAIDVTAKNKVTSVANATPQAAAFGASVGVSVINAITTTELAGNATVTAGSLNLDASTATDVTVTAVAGAGGATEPSAGSQLATFLSAGEYGEEASTSDGGISVAGALAISDLTSTTKAAYSSTTSANIAGDLRVASSSENHAEISSDGSAVESATGVGVAVGINIAKVKNDAVVESAVSAGSIHLSALSDNPLSSKVGNVFNTTSTSGAGASSVGVAGSFGLNLIDTQSTAKIGAGVAVNITGNGDIEALTNNETTSSVEAKPVEDGGASGDSVGIGASVGLNIIANRSVAEVGDGATVTGAGAVTLDASATHEVTTTAEAGSAGGVSITPVVALSMVNNSTTARLGTGAALSTTGAVSVSAAQVSAITTTAKADAAGAKAAIGASLALALVDDQVVATTDRNVSSGAAVSFSAIGASSSTLSAKASAAGAAEGDDAEAAPSSTGESVDKTATTKLTSASSKQEKAKVGSSNQRSATSAEASNESGRSAKSSEGKLTAAAAVAVNVQKSSVTAATPDDVNISAAGAFNVASANNTNGSATSDGSAVKGEDGSQAEVGIAVAASVNVVTETNTAKIGRGTHSAAGVNVSAMQGVGDPKDTIFAEATSGAGGSKVGIAGSLALNIVDVTTAATISGSAVIDAKTGASTIQAEETMLATAIAKPTDQTTTGGKFGLGASVALNLITTDTKAEVLDGAVITNGTGLTVEAMTDIDTVTEASAGAAGGIAVDASVALALLDQSTTARVGTGSGLSMGAGDVSISAMNTGTNTAKSTGETKGGKVAVGASAALILGDGTSDGALNNTSITTAALARDVTAGSLSLSASSERTYDADATATASGGEFDQNDEKANTKTGGTSTTATSIDKTKDSQRDSDGKQNGSKVTVAAAAGIAAAQDNVSATLGDVTVNINGSGAVAVSASNQIGMATSGTGLAADPKTNTGVGIGVGLGIINNKTAASVSDGATINSPGSVSITATSRENADDGYGGKLTALAVAGSSGKKVSVAGALAVGISTGETKAEIGNNVTITNSGAVAVKTENTSHLAAKALAGSVALQGTGIGASIAVVVADKDYKASIGTGSNIAASGLEVTALNHKIDSATPFDFTDLAALKTTALSGQLLGSNNYYVEALGGAAGSKNSVTGSFGVMVFEDNVSASVGSGTYNARNSDVTIKADNQFLAKALSGAISIALGGTGVGVAGSVIVSSGSTTSTLGDGAIVTNASMFTNSAKAAQDIQAFGVSIAAASGTSANGVATVITSENRTEALMGIGARVTATGAVNLTAENDFDTFSLAGGAAGGGSNAIGASGSVVVINNVTRAAMADGTSTANRAEINTDGAIEISAKATETGETIAAAGSAAGSTAVGAGAAVYVLGTTTEALVGDFAKVGNSHTAGDFSLTASDVSKLLSIGGALAGGGSTGAGAGVGVGVITKTTSAKIGASALVAAGNVVLDAKSEEDLDAITVGVGIGGSAGLAGAIAVYAVTTDTTAEIGNTASVYADGNVAVLADDQVSIDMLEGAIAGGGSAGIGASVGVTVINATTLSKIDDGALVTALGNDTAQSFTSGYGTNFTDYGASSDFQEAKLGNQTASAGASQTGFDLLTKERNATAITETANGVIVNASSMNAVRSMAVAGTAAGSVAVSISASVPVITTDTQAVIGDNAQINQMAGIAGAAQAVSVAAASDVYVLGFSGAVAIGGAVGGGAGVNAMVVDMTTKAKVGGGTSDISAQDDILVSAKASQDFAVWAVAGAGSGSVALAGSGAALVLNSDTIAELGGTAVAQNNIDILAHDTTRLGMLSGSVALGVGAVGIGAAVGVNIVDKTVTASVAESANVSAYGRGAGRNTFSGTSFTGTTSSKGLNVEAQSDQSALAIVVSGAGGLYAGIAGVLSLNLVTANTSAFIGANSQINAVNTNGSSEQDVVVTARDSTTSSVGAGAISGGLVGLSGAVDVGVFKTSTAGYIEDGVSIKANDDVHVSGLSNKVGDSKVASGSGGGFALAAGIAVYSYGDGVASGGEADTQLSESSGGDADMDGVNSDAQKQAKNDEVYDILKESDDSRVRDVNTAAKTERDKIDVAAAVSELAIPGGTSASIGNATINAGGTVAVRSGDDLDVTLTTGGFAVGGAAVGAGVGVLTVDTGNTAQITGSGATITAGAVDVKAKSVHSLIAKSYAAAAGASIAVSGDAAFVTDKSRTLAFIQGQTISVSGGVAVNADAKREIDADGFGASVGGIAGVGASITKAEISGAVNAYIKDATIGSNPMRGTTVTVKAKSDDDAKATAIAAGGGVGAAVQGAGSFAVVKPTVTATLDNADIFSTGAVSVLAEAAAAAETSSTGVAVAGGLAAGGSLADSTVTTTVAAKIIGGSEVDAGSINVASLLTTPLVKSYALGSAGALVGLSATDTTAENNATVTASVEGGSLTATGLINIDADATTNQKSIATGLAVGLVAAGFNSATAKSNTTTHATLSNLNSLTAGSLTINANGVDTNDAETVAGSGGVVAGSAASGTTTTTSDTLASAGQTSGTYTMMVTGDAVIAATHQSNFAGSVDSTQASLVGGSGAELYHTVSSAVDANLGDDVKLYAGNLAINAANRTTSDFAGWNVSSASGGLANLPAGGATVSVSHSKTNASVGAGSMVHLMPIGGTALSLLEMTAESDILSKQKVKIDSGGAVALADADISSNFVANTTVVIGDETDVIVDKGDIHLAAWGNADVDNRGSATTYGLAGAPSGSVDVLYAGNNKVEIGTNVRLEASDGINPLDGSVPSSATITLSAGKDLAGANGDLTLNAVLDIFNKTAIPIPASPNPVVNVSNLSTVIVKDSGAAPSKGVQAAGDIAINAHRGNIDASAVGTGKDIYREALAAVASAVSNAFGGGDVSFDYHGGTTNVSGTGTAQIDGLVATGLQRFKTVEVKYSEVDFQQGLTTCTVSTTACIADPVATDNIAVTITAPVAVGTEIFARLEELNGLLGVYGADIIASGAYANEIKFLQDKLVSLGLGTYDGTGAFQEGVYTGKSPKAVAQELVNIDQANIAAAEVKFQGATADVFTAAVKLSAETVQSQYNVASVGVDASLTSALNTVTGFSTYSAPVVGTAAQKAVITARNAQNAATASNIVTLVQEGQNAANTVAARKTSNDTAQANIDSNTTALIAAQASLAAAIETGIVADQTAAQLAIANAQTAIKTNLTNIASNNADMATHSQTAVNKANSAKAAISSLASSLSSYASGAAKTTIDNAITALSASNPTDINQNGALTIATNAIAEVDTNRSSIVSNSAPIATRINVLKAAAGVNPTTASATSVDDFGLVLTGFSTSLGTNEATFNSASDTVTGPMQPQIIVPDTVARLGNVSVTADNLTGTGKIAAPGDARILVENFTAATLKLNNLVIPTYDAGNVRLNGALVNSVDEINALNKSETVGAGFEVKTGLVSSRPMVEILSHYNPEDPLFHNSASALKHRNADFVAPDIILETGKILENTTGAVRIISDAGNIYVRGQINAGSVEIVAKNGDFVASYVNGFNHIGGDPAQFNDPTRFAEAGPGILANGGISIAARFLNINSTIQSGIVDLKLNLQAGDLLTTHALENIGLDSTDVANKIAAYRTALVGATSPSPTINVDNTNGDTVQIVMPTGGIAAADLNAAIADYTQAIVTNPNKDPLYSFDVGGTYKQVNIKDWIDGSISGEVQFTRLQAENFMNSQFATGEGLYQVISPTSTIGANYNAVDEVFEVNGKSVHGGYIQLYGQIMNTASGGGALKVLDGFGSIDIDNQTGKTIVLRTLNTGSDVASTPFNDQSLSQLRGTAGIIDITDVVGLVQTGDPANPFRANVKHTIYSRDYDPDVAGSGQMRIAQIDGYIDPVTGRIRKTSDDEFETTADLQAALSNTGTNRTATYTTTPNQRYVWTVANDKKTVTNKSNTQGGVFFNLVTVSDVDFYQGATTTDLGSTRLRDGTYVSMVETDVANALTLQTLEGLVVTNPKLPPVLNATISNQELYVSTYAYITKDSGIYEKSRSSRCPVACFIYKETTVNSQRDQEYRVVSTNSLKADHPIAIEFIGEDTGAISIDSNSDVIISSDIKSLGGSVSINATGANSSIIKGTDAGLITAQSAGLTAGGSVGGLEYANADQALVSKSIFVNMTKLETGTQGTLDAVAQNGNVSIFGRGDLQVGQITAASNAYSATTGNVELGAVGSISAASSASLVQGYKVSLSAVSGSIGETPTYDQNTWSNTEYNKLLHVNSGYTSDAALRPFGEAPSNSNLGLTAIAAGDIGIRSTGWHGNTDGSLTDGTMLINQALSLGGDVTLASDGQILDNNPVETIDTRTYNQLLGYWDSLGLLEKTASRIVQDDLGNNVAVDGISGNDIIENGVVVGVDEGNLENKRKVTIKAFENVKTKQYQQYWSIRNEQADTSVYDAAFVVTVDPSSKQYEALESYYKDQIKADNPAITDIQLAFDVVDMIEAYEAEQTKIYHSLHETVGGETGDTYDMAYKVVATQAEKDALTEGSKWTERELAFSIAPGALKTVTGTNPVIKDPNVSGRVVTILANKGIGETVTDGTNLGVSIRSSLDPALLTPDQKVALAAAERNDLLLTVEGVALPTTFKDAETEQKQRAAWAEYSTAVVASQHSNTVEIPLGSKFDDLSAVQQATLNAAAAGLVTAEKTVLTVLSKRPLNFNAADQLNVDVETAPTSPADIESDIGKAFLASQSGALLGGITTKGETRIKVRNDIANAGSGTISTGSLILEASQGGIGSMAAPLKLDQKAGATTTARAQNSVNLEFANGGAIDTIYSPQNVKLTALNGSLTNANGDLLINILGNEVTLTAANGTIGIPGVSLNVGVNVNEVVDANGVTTRIGGITANAGGSIDLRGPSSSKFIVSEAKSVNGGTITLEAAGDSTIDGEVDTAGNIVIQAGERQVLTDKADVTSGGGAASINAASLKMLNGSTLSAAGQVDIDTVGDALVTAITSSSGLINAVDINAGGQVFAGTLPGRAFDISATAVGAGVKVIAGLGIGDKTQANDTADDNAVTETSNPLRIITNALEAVATNGSIEAAALSDITLNPLTANNGSISVTGTGTMGIGTATSGGTQTFVAQDNVTFTQLTTTGLPADVGDVKITSVNGSITGGDIDSNGSTVITGNGVTFGDIMSGGDSTITSTGDITGDSQIAGGDVTDIAGAGANPGSLNIGVIGGQNLNLQATTELNLPDLRVAETLILRSDKITAGVTQVPSGPDPLSLTVTGVPGINDQVGTVATLNVDAPAGVVAEDLRIVDTTLETTATRTEIKKAFVPGSMTLTSPVQKVFVDNRTPLPQAGNNVQVHAPEFEFALTLDDNATSTNGFVVQYDETSELTNILPTPLEGISLVRDTIRNIADADAPFVQTFGSFALDDDEEIDLSSFDGEIVEIEGIRYMVFTPSTGPAVMLEIQ